MKHKILIILLFILTTCNFQYLFSQENPSHFLNRYKKKFNPKIENSYHLADTIKQKTSSQKLSFSGIFISIGGGLNVPVVSFYNNSNPTFGILGRLEFSSASIFPFVIGGEVNYFSYNGADQFKTTNLLKTYKTKILSYGLNIEYVLTKLFSSSYTLPFVTIDIKNNNIKREYDETVQLSELSRSESTISIGAGLGFTLFVFDFYAKYNYMKNLQNFGVYTKIKFPVIRF